MSSAVTCVIRCPTREESDRILRHAKDRVNLDRTMPNVIRYYPRGTEVALMRWYRLSDYFEEIKVQPGPTNDSPAFRLIFQPRADGDPYWKDVMVSILQDIRGAGEQVSITIERNGNSEPAEHVGTSLA
jgi:hypothetical protein